MTDAGDTNTGAPSTAKRFGIAAVVVVGVLVALNLVAGGIDNAVGGREPSGVAGSSYGSQDSGLAGLAGLLTHYGYPISRVRGSLADAILDPDSTVFVIEPKTLTDADDAALVEFTSEGGRLVIGGSEPFYLHRLRDRPPVWSPDGTSTYGQIDAQLGDISQVATAGQGSWSDPGSGVVVAGPDGAALVTESRVGLGEMFFVADVSPLQNSYLGLADNAAFALGLAGNQPRPVEFAEGVHGYGQHGGWGAIPTPWKVALAVLATAVVALAWSRSRRFGPPDRPARPLPPARAEYVRALAISLERTRDPEHALASMQQWARTQVARRAHLRPDASLEELDRGAIALGYTESQRAAIWHPATDDDAVLALGRLVSQLSQQDGRTT
ncbi:MAG: DUF4350 domain-containing protein [Acidimicrobiia bacterium]